MLPTSIYIHRNDTADTFDLIARSWYGFRHRSIFTADLTQLAERWKSGRLLNIGCAHGPDFLPFRGTFNLSGVDISREMLILARKYADKHKFDVKLILGDAVQLPVTDEAFDFSIAVASLHHIPEKRLRINALQELRRVLKPGGEAFVTLWNRYQPRFWARRPDTIVPWRSSGQVLPRFYHLYSYGEAVRDAKSAGFSILRAYPESGYKFPVKMFSRNICLLLRK